MFTNCLILVFIDLVIGTFDMIQIESTGVVQCRFENIPGLNLSEQLPGKNRLTVIN